MIEVANPDPTKFERALMRALLVGDDPLFAALRHQWSRATSETRELSGAGFFLNFLVPEDALRVSPPNFQVRDVWFKLAGLAYDGGAILFVRNGSISFLEAYSNDGSWPDRTDDFELFYFDGKRNLDLVLKEIHSRVRQGS